MDAEWAFATFDMMAAKRRHEPTAPQNPHRLTLAQHVHSRACIERFSDANGVVSVLRPGTREAFPAKSDTPVFCAMRVWDQHFEQGGLEHRSA